MVQAPLVAVALQIVQLVAGTQEVEPSQAASSLQVATSVDAQVCSGVVLQGE